jgi:hypothetical protein
MHKNSSRRSLLNDEEDFTAVFTSGGEGETLSSSEREGLFVGNGPSVTIKENDQSFGLHNAYGCELRGSLGSLAN